jgi:sulfur dioxygenase
MLFRQLLDRETGTYTYLIADRATKEAVLVDPVIEQVDRDLKWLQELGLTLKFCLETHIHADHITGTSKLRELREIQENKVPVSQSGITMTSHFGRVCEGIQKS